MSLQQTDRYDDIINLPHHRSCTRPHMSMHNRAAQFMPFAALTGYDDIIKQTATHSNEAVERANTPVNLAEGTSPPNMRRRPKKRLFGLTRRNPDQTKQPLYVRIYVRTLLWMRSRIRR